jgi:hypothetical protein
VELVEGLTEIATTIGASLERLGSGRDRFGPVQALLFAHGYVSVRSACDGSGYEVTIWAGDEICATGRTSNLPDIVGTMLGRQAGSSIRELCGRHEYLKPVGGEGNVEALWCRRFLKSDPVGIRES